jgi:hypothetical protein
MNLLLASKFNQNFAMTHPKQKCRLGLAAAAILPERK